MDERQHLERVATWFKKSIGSDPHIDDQRVILQKAVERLLVVARLPRIGQRILLMWNS